ncbi:MAG: NAD(P)(+) transhydrogenase (Re/Si-specific) subunit alpha, partial [Acidobacteriota bacterium]
MQITVIKEKDANEARVALVPESVKKLVAMNVTVAIESGAGLLASINDADYEAAGASLSADRQKLLASTDILLAVNRPGDAEIESLKKGAIVIAFLRPLDEPKRMEQLIARGLTAFSIELIPRTTRAQSMDGLSSMATIVGYKAVLIAAEKMPRMFPMLTTAAGTVPPARVLILGAGVAGLQAIATARRLGAIVEGFDVRSAAGEAVRSLGARFLEVEMGGAQTEDAGGYAREVTEEIMDRSRELIAKQATQTDCIVTSVQVPG